MVPGRCHQPHADDVVIVVQSSLDDDSIVADESLSTKDDVAYSVQDEHVAYERQQQRSCRRRNGTKMASTYRVMWRILPLKSDGSTHDRRVT